MMKRPATLLWTVTPALFLLAACKKEVPGYCGSRVESIAAGATVDGPLPEGFADVPAIPPDGTRYCLYHDKGAGSIAVSFFSEDPSALDVEKRRFEQALPAAGWRLYVPADPYAAVRPSSLVSGDRRMRYQHDLDHEARLEPFDSYETPVVVTTVYVWSKNR